MRILGLDVGSKTIGVAISDPLGWTAQGIDTIRRKFCSFCHGTWNYSCRCGTKYCLEN